VAAGERRNASVLEIVSHPSQPKLACAAQLAAQARELSRLRYLSPSYLHGDTLPSVTNHSERAHAATGQRKSCSGGATIRGPMARVW
jgi:hypothetical protein